MEKIKNILDRRIKEAKEDMKFAQSDMMYDRAHGVYIELLDLKDELEREKEN